MIAFLVCKSKELHEPVDVVTYVQVPIFSFTINCFKKNLKVKSSIMKTTSLCRWSETGLVHDDIAF